VIFPTLHLSNNLKEKKRKRKRSINIDLAVLPSHDKKLPFSSSFDTILVIVDCLSKQAIFIPTHDTITSAELARLFITHVFSKHGVPSHVMSDRGSEFVSHFFHSLGTALDMRLHFTSGYHPEANGQAERTNQMLEQYLPTRQLVGTVTPG